MVDQDEDELGDGWQWWDSPIRFPGGRHESSTRSIRKGDSLSGVSLSPILIPSPTLASPVRESPTPGARAGTPWGLPVISITQRIQSSTVAMKNQKYISQINEEWVQSSLGFQSTGSGWDPGFRSFSWLSIKIQSSVCLCISTRVPRS